MLHILGVDKAEDEEEIARNINVIGVKNLAIMANKNNSTLVHISTDYVFDGEKNIKLFYTEEDKTNPKSVYGKTKLESEFEVQENCEKYYVFRTSWLFGDGNNFVRTMIKLGNEKEEVSVVNDQYGSPTYCRDLANIIKQAIDKEIPYGIYHATNKEFTTWSEFTKQIFSLSNIKCKVKEISSKELDRKAQRPKNSKLSKEKLEKLGIIIPSYKDALNRFLNEEKKEKHNE